MKRAFCIISVFMLIFCTGCSQKQEVKTPQVKTGARYAFSADYNNMLVKGILSFSENSSMNFSITEPASLSGLQMSVSDHTVSVSYLGMKTELSSDKLPPAAFCRTVSEIFKMVPTCSAKKSGDHFELSGVCDIGNFNMLFDKSMNPLMLSIPDFSCEITFTSA